MLDKYLSAIYMRLNVCDMPPGDSSTALLWQSALFMHEYNLDPLENFGFTVLFIGCFFLILF